MGTLKQYTVLKITYVYLSLQLHKYSYSYNMIYPKPSSNYDSPNPSREPPQHESCLHPYALPR